MRFCTSRPWRLCDAPRTRHPVTDSPWCNLGRRLRLLASTKLILRVGSEFDDFGPRSSPEVACSAILLLGNNRPTPSVDEKRMPTNCKLHLNVGNCPKGVVKPAHKVRWPRLPRRRPAGYGAVLASSLISTNAFLRKSSSQTWVCLSIARRVNSPRTCSFMSANGLFSVRLISLTMNR